jgi:hypothetical protein
VGAGGRREGAGRKPGLLWRGSNAVSEQSRAQVEILQREHDADPRGFLASVMNDPAIDLQTRLSAACALMPFCYPKLSAQAIVSTKVESVDPGVLIRTINERLSRIASGGNTIRQTGEEKPGKPGTESPSEASAHTAAHISSDGVAP